MKKIAYMIVALAMVAAPMAFAESILQLDGNIKTSGDWSTGFPIDDVGTIATNGVLGNGNLNTGSWGTYTINHTAGTLTGTGNHNLYNNSNGTYNQSGGNISIGAGLFANKLEYNFSAGTVQAANVEGANGGTFNQTGGSFTSIGTVRMYRVAGGTINLLGGTAVSTTAASAFDLSSGAINVDGDFDMVFDGALLSGSAPLTFSNNWTGSFTRDNYTTAEWQTNLVDGTVNVAGTEITHANFATWFSVANSGAAGSALTVIPGLEPTVGAMVWTDDGTDHGTDDVTNWWNTATATYPTNTPSAGLDEVFTGGVVITNTEFCLGSLSVGINALEISNVASNMTGGNMTGTSTIDITAAHVTKGSLGSASVTLHDDAVLQIQLGGSPVHSGATIDLDSLTASLKFDTETATDFINEHAGKVTAFGEELAFGIDPFDQEPGDNALATAFNGLLGVEITAVTVVTNVAGALVWTGDGADDNTSTVSNWLNTASGWIPTETPNNALELFYAGGVVITNTESCLGTLSVGDNALEISNVASNMTGGNMNGRSTIDITAATVQKGNIGDAAVTLHNDAVLEIGLGGGPLYNGVTIDLNATSAILQFKNETWGAFTNEHINKVTSFGDALEFGSNPYTQELGDNALASDYNGVLGVQIEALDSASPIGDITIGYIEGSGMAISWDTSNGQAYNVETNANLVIPVWGISDGPFIGDGNGMVITSAVTEVVLFYKVTTP